MQIEALLDNDTSNKSVAIKSLIELQLITGMTMTINPNKYNKNLNKKLKFCTNEQIEFQVKLRMDSSRVWYTPNLKYTIYKEYTQNNIIHFHAIIYNIYPTKLKSLGKWWKREFGNVKLETNLRSKLAWIRYAGKNNQLFKTNISLHLALKKGGE